MLLEAFKHPWTPLGRDDALVEVPALGRAWDIGCLQVLFNHKGLSLHTDVQQYLIHGTDSLMSISSRVYTKKDFFLED